MMSRVLWVVLFLLISLLWGESDTTEPFNSVPLLTASEKEWLANHSTISVGFDPVWPPMEYISSEGELEGVSIGFIKEIESLLDLSFERVAGPSWDSLIHSCQKREIDMFACISQTSERDKFLLFTEPYISFSVAIFSRYDITYVHDMNELKGKKIGVIKGYAPEEWISHDYPQLTLVSFPSAKDGMKALNRKEVDLFIENIMSGSYTLRELGYTSIKVSGETPYSTDLRIGVRSDWPELRSIMQKALNAIPLEKKLEISRKWQTVEFTTRPDYSIVLSIVIPLIAVIIVIVIWNRRLKFEVILRKDAEERAYEASRAKSAFLANMSHEIRTPLNAIIGFAHIAATMTTDPKIIDYVTSIHRSGGALLSLLNDILDMSKVESGKLELQYQPLSFSSLLADLELLFRQQAEVKELELSFSLDSRVPKVLIADEDRLRQVLVNLIGNAVKFTTKGYIKVWVRADAITATTCTIIIGVEDSGKGIPLEQQELVFDLFGQAKGQSFGEYGGTGLGLAISRKLTELMGGFLTLESEEEVGSTFLVTLKDIEISSESSLSQTGIGPIHHLAFEPAKILVVDDITVNREIIKGYLHPYPFTILEAENGREALHILKRELPDLLFLDLKMPIMSGEEVVEEMKKSSLLAAIPIIIVTASVEKEEEERLTQLVEVFLRKPLLPEALIKSLMKYLPYSKTIFEEEVFQEAQRVGDLQRSMREDPNLLKDILDYTTTIDSLLRTMSIDEIETFAEKIREIANKYNSDGLKQWYTDTTEAVALFDIEQLSLLLEELRNVVQEEPNG